MCFFEFGKRMHWDHASRTVSRDLFIITAPVGIVSDSEKVFNTENCIIVPIDNNEALRDSIFSILDNKINLDKAKMKNYFDFKKRFDIEPVFDNIGTIYRNMLDNKI
jgi:hypothetical protein